MSLLLKLKEFLIYPLPLTGMMKEPSMKLKTKDNVVLVGLSPPLEDYKD